MTQTNQEDNGIRVLSVQEHEAGDATIIFELSEQMKQTLLQYALIDILRKVVNKDSLDNQCFE